MADPDTPAWRLSPDRGPIRGASIWALCRKTDGPHRPKSAIETREPPRRTAGHITAPRPARGQASWPAASPSWPPGECSEYLVECLSECREVAVVHAAGVDLLGEFAERGWPRWPRGRHAHLDSFDDLDFPFDLDEAVDDFDGGENGGCCSSLVPGALTARWRAPFGQPSGGSYRDGCSAPAAGMVWPGSRAGAGLRLMAASSWCGHTSGPVSLLWTRTARPLTEGTVA